MPCLPCHDKLYPTDTINQNKLFHELVLLVAFYHGNREVTDTEPYLHKSGVIALQSLTMQCSGGTWKNFEQLLNIVSRGNGTVQQKPGKALLLRVLRTVEAQPGVPFKITTVIEIQVLLNTLLNESEGK